MEFAVIRVQQFQLGGAKAPPNAHRKQDIMFYCLICKTKIHSRCAAVTCKNCNRSMIKVSRRLLPVVDALLAVGFDVGNACEYTFRGGLDSFGGCLGYYNMVYVEFNRLYSENIFREFDGHRLFDYWEHRDITDEYNYTQLTFSFDFPARNHDKRVLKAVKAISKCAIDELREWAVRLRVTNADSIMVLSGLL